MGKYENPQLDWWHLIPLNRHEVALERAKIRSRTNEKAILDNIDRDVIEHMNEPMFRKFEVVEAPIEHVLEATGLPLGSESDPAVTKGWGVMENNPLTGEVVLIKKFSTGENEEIEIVVTAHSTEVDVAHAMENPR